MSRKQRASSSPYKGYAIFLLPGLLIFLIFIIFPFVANIGISFTKWTGVGIPKWTELANYVKAFNDKTFWASFKNNLTLILVITTIPTLIGLFLAGILSDYVHRKFGRRVTNFFRAGFYLPQIIPIVVSAVVWRWILQPEWGVLNQTLKLMGLGSLANNWLGEPSTALFAIMGMLIWFQIGYPLVIFMSGIQRINPELDEAAAIDGASWMQRFVSITIPLLRPEMYVVLLTTTIHTLKTFGPIYTMTRGGPGTSTTMVASYFSYKNFFETSNVGYGATIATILTTLTIIFTIGFLSVQTQQEYQETL